ncbi:MAG: HflK protein, partial [Celeribacter marinus]
MASNNGGPWGSGGGGNRGGSGGDDNDGNRNSGGRRPNDPPQLPEIDELLGKGSEYLKVLMGGRGGGSNGTGSGAGGGGPKFTRSTVGFGALIVVGLWALNSFYTVKPEEQSVELFLGEFSSIGNPGLNFAPWPL